MPTISQFFGILIHMYIRGEHNPPHFHALYAEHEALIDIHTLEIIRAACRRERLPWCLAAEHRSELMEDWNLCRAKQLPKPIKPLE